MKNLMRMAAMMVVALAMFACGGGSNTPTGVAEKAMKCLQKGDYEGYVDLLYVKAKEGKDVAEEKKQFTALVQEKGGKSIEQKGGIKSYETVSEEIDESGEKAVVKMKVVYGNSEDEEAFKLRKDEDGKWKIDLSK